MPGQRLVGPAYADIAKRYKYQYGAINNLVGKILEGNAGTRGQVPMTPHSQLSTKDAHKMVKCILLLPQGRELYIKKSPC